MGSRQYWVIGLPTGELDAERGRQRGSGVLGPFPSREQACTAAEQALHGLSDAGSPRYSIIASAHNPVRRHFLAAVDRLHASQ
jgi:hypothetical protein